MVKETKVTFFYWVIMMGKQDVAERLRNKFLKYAKKLQNSKKTEERELGRRVEAKLTELVEWYLAHDRDMTTEEFQAIVRG